MTHHLRAEEPLTFHEAAKEMRWEGRRQKTPERKRKYINGVLQPPVRDRWQNAGRRLRRLCVTYEKRTGVKFIIRDGGGNIWKVTIGALLRHIPEMRSSHLSSVRNQLKPIVEGIERRAIQRDPATAKEIRDELARLRVELEQEKKRVAYLMRQDQRRREQAAGLAKTG